MQKEYSNEFILTAIEHAAKKLQTILKESYYSLECRSIVETLANLPQDMEPGYLAKVLADLGPESCDRNMFLDVLQQLSPMLMQGGIESQVGQALAMMCRPQGAGGVSPRTPSLTWNTTTFGSAVLESVD